MTSWRETVSQQAQDDLDKLLDFGLDFARQQLARHGEFYPFAAAITVEGHTEGVAVDPNADNDRPSSTDVIDACVAGLTHKRDRFRATAVIADVKLMDSGQDAIAVGLEHADGPAITVHLPYTKRRLRGIHYGDVRASPGARRIWA